MESPKVAHARRRLDIGTAAHPGKHGGVIHPIDWLMIVPSLVLLAALAASIGGLMVLHAERGAPMRVDARLVSLAIREAIALTLSWLVRPLGWANRPPAINGALDGAARPLPVLLVAAPHANRASMFALSIFLKQRGFSWVWPVSLAGSDRPLADQAAVVDAAVRRLRDASGAPSIDIVAHGAGGLAAAWAVRHLDAASAVRQIVCLGTPWRGTKTAVFRVGAYAEDVCFESSLLDGLLPCGAPIVSIYSPDDASVVPTASASPDVTSVHPVQLEGAGHWELLMSARAFRAVLSALLTPSAPSAAPEQYDVVTGVA